MRKYGEPWTVEQYLNLQFDSNEPLERIVSCVNACAGMEDPEKEIADLREQNISLLRLLADIRAAAGDSDGRLMQDELVEHIGELVRIFNAGEHLYYELGGEAESKEVAKALHCKQETVRRLWGLWPKQGAEINHGDLADATEGLI